MKTNQIITSSDLCSQGVKLVRQRLERLPRTYQLAFADRMHNFNLYYRTARTPERFETYIGLTTRFTGSVPIRGVLQIWTQY